MTTFTLFQPSPTTPFQFSPTLNGALYTAIVTWGLAGQRWYVNLYDQNNTLVFYLPLIASPTALTISSATWSALTNLITIVTVDAHGIPLGTVVDLTITGVVPTAYNGIWRMTVTNPNTFTFPQSVDPGGDATVPGSIGRDINLAAGYIPNSTLVFRDATQMFEVSP